jgi:predicted small integral membrane protein
MYTRLSKVVLVWSIALFAAFVAFSNLTDYDSNFIFVSHVLKMDTTFPDNKALWRAIESPIIHHMVYGMIIITELVIAGLCAIGGYRLCKNIQHPRAFNQSKKLAIVGLTSGFMLWFTGFMTIGGEWFLMWQSEVANGQEASFRFVVIISLLLIYLTQTDDEKHS